VVLTDGIEMDNERHEIHEHDDMIWYDTDETTKQAMLPEQSQTENGGGSEGE
jgi:hypothetical protein